MRICHRYRDLMDTKYIDIINLDEYDLVNEDKYNCKLYTKDDTDKLAIKNVYGLKAQDIAEYFWNVNSKIKLEWDSSLQSMKILEKLSPNCAILHLKMKRIWPAKPRDCIICSEILQVNENEWIVNNQSIDYNLNEIDDIDYVRMTCNINMRVVQMNNNLCKITYSAKLDVGGYIPNMLVKSRCHKEWSNVLENLCVKLKERLNSIS